MVMMVVFSILVPLWTAASLVSSAVFRVVIAIRAGAPTPIRMVLAVFFSVASDFLLFADLIPVMCWSYFNTTRMAWTPFCWVSRVPVWKLHLFLTNWLFPLVWSFGIFWAIAVKVDLTKGDTVTIHSPGKFLRTFGHLLPLRASWTSYVIWGACVLWIIVLEGVAFLFVIIVQEWQATLLLFTHANTKCRLVSFRHTSTTHLQARRISENRSDEIERHYMKYMFLAWKHMA